MRIKIGIAVVVAILGMVNTASATVTFSMFTDTTGDGSVGSGAYSVAAGGNITVYIYFAETLTNGSQSLLAQYGLYSAAFGVNNTTTGSTATMTSIVGNGIQGFGPNTTNSLGGSNGTYFTGGNGSSQLNSNSAGNSGAILETAPNSAYSVATGLPSTSPILLGAVTINVQSGTTTYNLNSGYVGSQAYYNPSPSFVDGLPDGGSDFAFTDENDGISPYVGAFGNSSNPGSGYNFTVAPSGSGPPPVPEPSSMLLCGFALSGLGYRAWRRRKAQTTETEPAVEAAV